MTLHVSAVSPAAALPALAEAVRSAKRGRPLRPVRVVVPTNATGVTARRWLGHHGGVAAVDMLTIHRLAEIVAAPALHAEGRHPVSTPVVDLAIRAVLGDGGSAFDAVADHPSTVAALRDLHRELRAAGPEAVTALAGSSSRGRDAARVSALAARRLASDWYDEGDLLQRAVAILSAADGGAGGPIGDHGLGPVVVFLPHALRGLERAMLGALAAATEVRVLLLRTGQPAVDAEMADLAAGLGAGPAAAAGLDPDPPVPGRASPRVISTTDADDEVRHAVRALLDHARAGTPFARMAIVWPTDRPYARLVQHHLDAAAIPWNGRPGTLVSERVVPRFLLDLLQVDRRGLRRRDLFDLLADVPVRATDGAPVPVARWERVSREAGVNRAEHWRPRLTRYAARERRRVTADGDDGPPVVARADAAEALAAFVHELERDLGPPATARRWSEWADWCEEQIDRRLGRRLLGRLDEAERQAHDHTARVLERLRHLDSVGGTVRRREFRAVFAAEFEAAPGRLGHIGQGITVGSLSGAVGLDADVVVVLGAADGLLPPAPASDPLLTDLDRRRAGLPTSDVRTRRAHRNFLALLASVPAVIISVPRGDLRASVERQPSRWIAAHVPDATFEVVSSHHAGLLATTFPAAEHEHRLRTRIAVAARDVARLADACAGDPVAARALRLRAARRLPVLTEYDGDLSGIEIAHFERPVSPSQLEAWSKCPHAYFVQYLLGVRPLDDVTEEFALSPLERGNVVHTALDRFNRLVLDGSLPQPGGDGWSSAHAARLVEIYQEVADEFERSGRTGRAAHWHLDRSAVERELLTWFGHDGRTAAERGVTIVSSEMRFGRDGSVCLPLPDGRRLAVHGAVDRIDRRENGDLVVMDHKTGGDRNFKRVTGDDPTERGTKFQLPAYAAAALAGFADRPTPGAGAVAVHAEYDFFGKAGYKRYGYTFDADVWARVADDLAGVVDGIESGLFPATPEQPKYEFFIDCHYCQPDALGTAERFAEWDLKRHDPRLAPWFADPGEASS